MPLKSAVAVLGALVVHSEAHNWMSSPSRANNNFNAYQIAPCPPKGGRIHFQVAAGQKFPMEFATGHSTPARGGTYLTVVKAEDEKHLKKHTRALLDDYIDKGWAKDQSYMSEHVSHHVGGAASSTESEDQTEALTSAHAVGVNHIRDYPFWSNKPARGRGIFRKTAAARADDRRVKDNNPAYPWIIASHKFKLHEDKPDDADLVMMEIPAGSPPGQYVIQYSWNGYYDCTDVNVIEATSTDLYGRKAAGIQYDQLDHCLWMPDLPGYSVLQGSCKAVGAGEGASVCYADCNNNAGCTGVQVVPGTLPTRVTDLGQKGLFQGQTSHLPAACNGVNIPEGSQACFSVTQGESVVGPTYHIVPTDVHDSVFYGTCLTKGGAWEFDQNSPSGVDGAVENVFRFGRHCISCEDMRTNQNPNVVPVWNVSDTCQHCNPALG